MVFPLQSKVGHRAVVFVLTSIALTASAAAQRSATPGFAAASHSHSPAPSARGRSPYGFRRSSPYLSPYESLPFPFFGDNFDSGDIYSTGYPVSSEPPPYLMQAMQQMAARPAPQAPAAESREPSPSQPLMIELQNGRYVKVSSQAIDGETREVDQAQSTATSGRETKPKALTPAVLIFRDGHSEEVRDYTITSGTLYAVGDYYKDGYWNKKIDLTDVDLTRTQQANADRNVNFILPASSNEVIARF